MKNILSGAVAYDPKAVSIWEGIKEFFIEQGCPMDFVLFSNYERQVEHLLKGDIDIAWNTNLAFVKLDAALSGKTQLLAMRDTDVDFKTVLIARADSTVRSISDLRGKTIAFGSADSVQAAIMPEFCLLKVRLAAETDYDAMRLNSDVGKHGDTGRSEQDVVAAVLDKSADVGAIGKPHWDAIAKNDQLRLVWTSPGYSHCVFNALPSFDGEQFKKTLFQMDWNNPKHRPILELEGLRKWVPASREGYASVKEAVNACYRGTHAVAASR